MIKGLHFPNFDADFSYLARDRQTLSVTDLISEGPIYGLVDGAASVYLNDDRAVPLSEASSYYSQSAALAAFTNGSTSVTISGAGDNPIVESEAGIKYLIVRAGYGTKQVTATDGSAGNDNYAVTATLTTQNTDSFFTADMVSSPADVDTHVPARLGIVTQAGGFGDGAFGEGWIIKRTSASVAEFVPGNASGPSGLWIPDGVYFLEVDKIVKISSVSGQTVTLAAAWTGATGSFKFDVTGAIVTKVDPITQSQTTNHEGVTTQFRVGTLAQTPFSGRGGNGSTSISNSPSAGGSLQQSDNYGGDDAAKVLVGSSAAGFNLTASQLQEVDEARFTIAYASGHYAVNGNGGDDPTFTQYRTQIAIKKPGESSFENFQVLKHPLTHNSMDKNAASYVETIDLTMFRPFSDFKIQVERITDHEGPAIKEIRADGTARTFHDWTQVTASALTNTTCVIKDILTHPFSAIANVTFDTKKFQSIPTRSYHLRGLKVSVPSNYVTREQTSDGVASYNRNITSGAITSSYQDWDGAFASEKVYTNNPAWIFYDILTNNRYGLGDFLKDTDVDKYALYRISRYCDALVDDGKGGLEPRFTSNLYFTKAADAYKVLKDMGTVFRSMLYYIDGKVIPIMDAPSGPVYNFTKANVIDGAFSYEGTGSKTRINQCVVTWIDPEANYKASPLLVEDRLNIAKTGTIISQNAMAMGATSEGQALRYGRWKLWTAANQREVVNFSTALNASFLMPGDVINIQDSDRYAVRIGGRVSNSGTTRSVSSIPLDSTTSLISGSTYQLSIMFVEPGAFATEDVTISGVNYKKGDLVKQAFVTGSSSLQNIDTEVKASNARLTNGGLPLVLSWSEHTRVETQDVTAALAGNSVDTITVTTGFSAVPPAESIWVLTETAGGLTVLGSAKEYKVLAISQSAKNEFGISAVEHYDEKFAAVDEDFTTYIADSVYPAVRHNDVVPPVTDVYATSVMNPDLIGEELTIQWSPPRNVSALEGNYEHLAGYEIHHDFPKIENPITINNSNQTSWSVEGIIDGTYNIAVKTINILQNVSVPTVSVVVVSDKYKENIPRLPEGVPYGGTTSVGFGLLSSSFTFQNYQYAVKSPSDRAALITNTSTSSAAWQQSCTNLPVITWSESSRPASGGFIDEHAYILMDASDSSDRLKLVKYHKPALSTPFWYDMGSGNSTKYGSALTGTFSKAAGTTKVTGSNTAFLSQIKDGDSLKLNNTEGYKVAAVVSDTLLYVTNNFSSFVNVSAYLPNIRIDYANDVIIARIYRTSSGLVIGEVYTKIDAVLKKAKTMIEQDGIEKEQIAENAVGTTEIDTSAATGGTFGKAVAALGAASFTTIDANVLNADSVIAREVQVFPSGGTAPTISGTTLSGAGIDLKQDGDLYVGNAAANKYIFWDQSAGVMTFRGALNAGDISAGSIDADRITARSISADKITAGSLTATEIASNAITTVKLAANAITTNKLAANAVTAAEINVSNLSSLTADLGTMTAGSMTGGSLKGGTLPEASSAPTGTEAGTFMDLSGGRMVLGNASKYIWWDGTNLTINGVTISNAALSNSSGIATETFVTNAINALVAGAPDTLNTLDEIAASIADNSSFAGAMTTSLAGKVATNSAQSLSNIANAMTISGSTITLNRGNSSTDTVTVPDTNTQLSTAEVRSKFSAGTNVAISSGVISSTNTQYSVGDGGLTTKDFTTALFNKLNGGTFITDNSQIANTRGYITTSNNSAAATLGGIARSGFVETSSNQALGTGANVLTVSGSTVSLVRASGDTDTVTLPNDNTQYSTASSSTLGLVKIGYSESGKNYPVELSSGQMFVNVPWSDTNTNTTYAAGTGITLSGTTFSNAAPDRTVAIAGAGATTVSGTYPSFTVTSTDTNTDTTNFNIQAESGATENISAGETVKFTATGAATVTRSGNTVNIASVNTNDNYFVSSLTWATGTGVLTLNRSGPAALTIDLDGRYLPLAGGALTGALTTNSTIDGRDVAADGVTADAALPKAGGTMSGALNMGGQSITTSGNANIELDPGGSGVVIFKGNSTKGAGQFKLNCEANTHGITIKGPPHSAGASYTLTLPNNDGNANQVLKTDGSGVTSWVDQSSSGVSTIQAGSGVNGIIVGGGTSATATLSVHANLEAIADADQVASLAVDFLEAGTIVADNITADTINATHLAVSNNANQASNAGIYFDPNGVITIRDSAGAIRVKIGVL